MRANEACVPPPREGQCQDRGPAATCGSAPVGPKLSVPGLRSRINSSPHPSPRSSWPSTFRGRAESDAFLNLFCISVARKLFSEDFLGFILFKRNVQFGVITSWELMGHKSFEEKELILLRHSDGPVFPGETVFVLPTALHGHLVREGGRGKAQPVMAMPGSHLTNSVQGRLSGLWDNLGCPELSL